MADVPTEIKTAVARYPATVYRTCKQSCLLALEGTARLRSQTVGFLSQEVTTKVLLSFRANPTMLQADTDSYVGNASLEEVPFSRSHVDPSRFSALLPRTSESNESKNCFASGSESGETNG